MWRVIIAFLLVAVPVATSFLVTSCATTERMAVAPAEVPGASLVGNKVCAECHQNYTKLSPGSPHTRMHAGVEDKTLGGTSCESCHGPGSLHVQAGGGRKLILNPGKDAAACFRCHSEVQGEFHLPQHHPVLEKKMNCVDCHDPHGADLFQKPGGFGMAHGNNTCASCHQEQTKPVIFEHEALREGCTVCHSPHGSINDKMLVQRDNNLCLKCHAQVHTASGDIYIGESPHTTFLNRGTCWTSGCHTAVHGSNIDSRLRY